MRYRDAEQPSTHIPVFDATVTDSAKRYVNEVLDSGWVSSAGPMVGRFEQAFADRIGVRHAISTSSGTTALHLALALLELRPGDEVIVPDFTMIATVCAVLYTGATPVFVDVDPQTGTLDPALTEAAVTARTRAILPVHIYGHSADMDAILRIADAHDLWVIEDAAEAHGARYRGRACGSLGDLAAFSFYANKIISTGEGGMLTTNDDDLATQARSLRNLAHRPGARFVHDELGFSYRMGSLPAALGLGQLEHIDEFLAHRRWMASAYAERLGGIAGLCLPTSRDWADNVHWMYAVRIEPPIHLTRDAFAKALATRGIETRPFFQSCSAQRVVVDRLGPHALCPVSAHLAATGLYLPSGLALSASQLDRVCDVIQQVLA
ncbi:MAG: DegT/DnrJ/EryC1/StrS family aminotransferase [Pseudomarimonas sp.]